MNQHKEESVRAFPYVPSSPTKYRTKENAAVKSQKSNIFIFLIFVAGLSLILYPSISDWWNSMHQTRAVASYLEEVTDMTAEEHEQMYQEAVAYNEKLAQQSAHYNLTEEEEAEYDSILDVTGTGIMGYVSIPKIDVELPIYHGTDDAVLQIAVGHLAGSSLPVGGESTHCVISGHSGLPSAVLLTNLNKLVEGDTFTLTTLDRTMTYQVDQIRIVLPDELQDLAIEEGQDYCTLVTCTPYGVNTHRLLVRGHRIANAADEVRVTADALQIDSNIVAAVLAAVIIFVYVIVYTGVGRRKKRDEKR